MSDNETSVPDSGVSANVDIDEGIDSPGIGGQLCYNNSDSTFSACVSGSTADKGTVGIGFNVRF